MIAGWYDPTKAERATPSPHTAIGRAVGQDMQWEEILALTTRHRVERPAIRMEGGTIIILWSGKPNRRLFYA